MKRSRGRNRRPGGNQQNTFNNPNRHFESVGPDVKIRGSAQQVLEKYQQYARDAHTSGDRVLSEAYFQYAEHYQRIVAKQTDARNQQGGQQQQNRNNNGNGNGNGSGGGPRDDRDPRGSQDRDPRGASNDDQNQGYDDQDEADVMTPMSGRRNDEKESDSLRVIDRDDDRSEMTGSGEAVPAEARVDRQAGDQAGDKGRRPRKPYRSREEGSSGEDRPPREDRAPREAREPRPPREPVIAVSETDGIMKTLARGRRRPAPGEVTPGETTD